MTVRAALSVALLGLTLSSPTFAQPNSASAFLPPLPAGKAWKLIWSDEIDIVEIPWRDGRITMNLHWDGYGKEHKTAGGKQVRMPELTEGFHDYALLWTPEEYVFYVDGQEVWRTKAGGVAQVPEFIKLTEEIGPWGGDITKAQLPDYAEVDFVRVYEMSK